ncbi:flagellar hook-associated protein FlgL [Aestuariirhabdus litorea]|uniref:Flagellar hook-associated protein FlgL n=1 Tax=Aestuariirhabdus litorea TaxID=2528527 RepID=A0A3P3VRD1_9GAMM|nr:flagellar hook-associated protein FlgL [Aestuariirhabdus litorea]RRJ85004.1 flagellar hook-associated protein FlgL [Aestuariirhabdus litorea]RWW98229.1 flagellar hook-associated protein FlgL [Endozoicomonadaceae bacterium GTF-13]
MRISTVQAFSNGVKGIQDNYNNVTRTQEQVSSGKRLLTAADDPVASTRLVQLAQERGRLDEYLANLDAAEGSLQTEESILTGIENVIYRLQEIAIQAGDGAQDSADKQALATEVEQRLDEMLDLMNSRNSRGEYIFGGNQGKQPPFSFDAANSTFVYNGDEGQREVQIAGSSFLPINDNGKRIFMDIPNETRVLTAAGTPNSGSAVINNGELLDNAQFDAYFDTLVGQPQQASLSFTPNAGVASGYDVFLIDANNPAPGVAIPAADVTVNGDGNLEVSVAAMGQKFTVAGTPAAGDQFDINRQEKIGLLDSVAGLAQTLRTANSTPTGGWETIFRVGTNISNINNGHTILLETRSEIGSRLNVVESTRTNHEDVKLINQSLQSDLEDLDYAEALSRLSFQSVILEAAQQSFVKISGLSLFNRL